MISKPYLFTIDGLHDELQGMETRKTVEKQSWDMLLTTKI